MTPPRLIIRDVVLDDVDAIAAHIAADNLDAALRFYDAAQAGFDFLAATPGAGPRLDPPIELVPATCVFGRSCTFATTSCFTDRSTVELRSCAWFTVHAISPQSSRGGKVGDSWDAKGGSSSRSRWC
jgi:plasmid stabilization system protein ParE